LPFYSKIMKQCLLWQICFYELPFFDKWFWYCGAHTNSENLQYNLLSHSQICQYSRTTASWHLN
jgi:hypothetical protein